MRAGRLPQQGSERSDPCEIDGGARYPTRVNRFKNLPGSVLLTLVALLMAVGAGGSLWAAGTRPGAIWQNFWVGIATTCIGIFGTVFLVDRLLKRVEERRRSGLNLHVRQRVSRIAFHETAMMIAMLRGHPEGEARLRPRRDGEGINRMPDGFAAGVDEAIDAIARRLGDLEARDWTSFGRSFDRMAMEYARLISLFGYEMDAEVLRMMLRVEESAHRLSEVIADRERRLGDERAAVVEEASGVMDKSIDIIEFHMKHIMKVNLEILRKV